MYSRKSRLISNIEDPSNYIDGFDVYNSILLDVLSEPSIQKESYEITVNQYRPDLIAEDYYGSVNYMGLVLIQNCVSLDYYSKGKIIKLIPKTVLDSILKSI